MITPHEHQPKLAAALGLADLYFKREDRHPYGSHKGRSIPVMIDRYRQAGERRFAVSSSGNAALAAALYIQELNVGAAEDEQLSLDIFIGQHVAPAKAERLRRLADGQKIRILAKERPLQALNQAVEEGARSLRQSTDDLALVGYGALAEELAAIPGIGAIFIGTSSGTTAQALAGYFLNEPAGGRERPPQIHIVQTSSCHPIIDAFEIFDAPAEQSLADAIVDRTAYRKAAVVELVRRTGGRGWLATNEAIRAAKALTEKHAGLSISANSALSVAGAMQSAYAGHEFAGAAVCLVCGD